jgi:hypothetical protein
MRCTNIGTSAGGEGEDIRWFCSTVVPKGFKLGDTTVSCEGYRDKEESYVLEGSCGVVYSLLLTSAGEIGYRKGVRSGSHPPAQNVFPWATWLRDDVGIFLFILFWVYRASIRIPPQVVAEDRQRQEAWRRSSLSSRSGSGVSGREGGASRSPTSPSSAKCCTSVGSRGTTRR